ncbi:hypothetical protein SLE2022_104560 [Rubroshorea leprosula]
MPSNRRTSNEYFEPEPSRNMGSLEAKNGLKRQQNSRIVKEFVQLPQGNKGNAQGTVKAPGDCPRQCVTRTAAKNDELVKHMSNLPSYLLRAGKQENIQEKALNVGVLDWGRLQNWKHRQNGSPTGGGSNISSKSSSLSQKTTAKSFSLPNTVPADAQANKRKQLELRKKGLQHLETDEKRSGSLWLRTSALPITVPEDTLSDKSKELEMRKKEMQNSDDSKHLPGELKNMALLFPKRSAQYSSTLEKPPELLDKNLTKVKSPDDFIQKSEKPHSQIPHSCPLPSRFECDSETDLMAEGLELLSDASLSSFNSKNKGHILLLSECKEQKKVESETASNETLEMLDQEMAELANFKSRRNQASHRRFSFSFSQMGRSFSFKEGPVVQKLSSYVSVKSGPVKSEAAVCLDDSSREKVKSQNGTRPSSLRRMLAPLLGPKSLNSLGCTEILQPLEGSLNCGDSWPTASDSFKKEKHELSTIQALMQLTLKDGLPLFKFVVDNSSNILVATMKMSSSGGGEMEQNYTFYSVNEIKKKIGGWLSQGSKERSCSYAYDTIGEMKISSSYMSNVKDSNNQNLIRESVLFGVDYGQANQASQKFTCNIELAAVVVKMPKEDFIHGVKKSCKDTTKRGFTESLQKDGCCFNFNENEGSNSTTVILPGAIHSLPNRGSPSPLIHRWRSGGSCDCGGWDVGCKLRILSNQNGSSNSQMTCQACLNPNCVELFVQDETQQIRPVFSLAPHKHGLYTIQFDPAISALQAFFISVTVICCQKSSILLEVNELSSEKVFEESALKGSDGMGKKSTTLLGKMPTKYAPNPPLSPFGRV